MHTTLKTKPKRNMREIRKAEFPLGGAGIRFLVATKSMPKELLSTIQYAVGKADPAGFAGLIFVPDQTKRLIEDHFDANPELDKGKDDVIDIVSNLVPEGVRCIFLCQPEAIRLGHAVLYADPAVGGSRVPKDTSALTRIGQVHLLPQRIVEAVIGVSDATKSRMAKKVVDLFGGSVSGKTIAILDATFKSEAQGATVRIVVPKSFTEGEALLPDVDWIEVPYVAGAVTVVFLTEWHEFRSLARKRLSAGRAQPRMADLSNIYDAKTALDAGFKAIKGVEL